MNNIKVNANFTHTTDDNLDLQGLRVTISYSIPSVFGFTKPKGFTSVIIQETTIDKFLAEAERLVITGEIKTTIRGLVEKHIMKRLVEQYENQEDKINNILNALNQMKFDFSMDIPQAEKTAINANNVAFKTPTATPSKAQHNDYSSALPRKFSYGATTNKNNNELEGLFD